MNLLSKIVSGGQSGVDRAALDLAIELRIPHGGWCPKGRLAEDGRIAEIYSLEETPLEDVDQRTEWNVRDSDATLILTWGVPAGGTKWTIECAENQKKPFLIFDIESPVGKDEAEKFHRWLENNSVRTLNVAGPRESLRPGVIYSKSQNYLRALILCR